MTYMFSLVTGLTEGRLNVTVAKSKKINPTTFNGMLNAPRLYNPPSITFDCPRVLGVIQLASLAIRGIA
jgi:hypothetical protein